MVHEFGGRARFVTENYGDSDLAKRFGVTRYPAIFVDDVLVATPRDFGFYGKGEGAGEGRYTPFRSAAGHDRFRSDLARMIDLVLAGRKDDARARAAPAREGRGAAGPRGSAGMPAFTLTDLDGRTLSREDLAGRVALVEFWATWCPPCRGTLGWLGALKKRHADRLAVLAIAVQSEEAGVRKIAGELDLPFVWAMETPDLVRSFGDVSAVPTLFMFGADGRAAGEFFGAPPTLHADVEAALAALLGD